MLRRTASLPPGTFEILTDPDLLREMDGNPLKVLLGVAQHARPSDEAAWVVRMSQDELAAALGMTAKTLRGHVSWLCERGWLLVQKAARPSDPDSVWLLWTAPVTGDGSPWRPGRHSETDIRDGNFSPGNDYRGNFSPSNSFPAPEPSQSHGLREIAPEDLPDLHAYLETKHSKNAGAVESARLLDDQPCPPDLDRMLSTLGFHGNVRLPAGMTVQVTVEDLHAVVAWLISDQAKAAARGKRFNAAGVLANRLKSASGLHEALVSAAAEAYLARYRAATAERDTRPLWCGVCDERSRLREKPESGVPFRCPDCHPSLAVAG